ncbi:AAA family ATPase [Vibrio sp. 10N.222.47.A9]|uniref:AAA family ATPase n=1 Tax=Vibrio sp. 10N.222.47.A9 TaxID=1903178 RepID=UPI000977FF9B|nr:AAA family ATPase [Vibrio sp. 10N.222.47.A9]OMO28493.1 AAA family ATPase [Vibrio sp. 10N.222.47.A9]
MRLKRLALKEYRNLRGVDITFSETFEHSSGINESEKKTVRSHALIGQNGTGKSNLLEALVTIFRDIDLDLDISFDYVLEYSIRGHQVKIEADMEKRKRRPYVWVDGKSESQSYLLRNKELLPSHIFAYYSGRNERMEALFQSHQRRFNKRQEITAEEVIPAELLRNLSNSEADREAIERVRRLEDNKQLKNFGDDRLRRLFYCRGGHSQLVLLACLLSDDPVFKKVLENLNIESLESALFVLKQPHRLRKLEDDDIEQGDPRFWYARGNVVSEFLDKLWKVSWAPIRNEESKLVDFRGRRERQRQLYMYVPTPEKLRELGELVGTAESFFRYAEGAYIGDLIDEVRITVKKKDGHGGKVDFTQLSEGELQMLTVLGLMRITNESHSLFLLDEPDTHLNPIWKLRYFDDIEDVLNPSAESIVQGESQVLITTHDPIMIGSLKKEQVHIIRKNGEKIWVDQPDEHPQGMGVTGLLKSDLFGLSSTLDRETERRLYRRNELFAKETKTASENEELAKLSRELADIGFSMAEFKDPVYAMFVRKMAQHRKYTQGILSSEEIREQEAIVDSIIDDILGEEN